MEIALTPYVEQYIQAKVSIGQYASVSEVFLAGIQLLQDIEQTYQGSYQTLRDEVKSASKPPIAGTWWMPKPYLANCKRA